jgi:hypothetical protein
MLACKQWMLPAGKTLLAGQLYRAVSTSAGGGFVVVHVRYALLLRVAVCDIDA